MCTVKEHDLVTLGFNICNAKISSADICIEAHDVFACFIGINTASWGSTITLPLGTASYEDDPFESTPGGTECLYTLMRLVGVRSMSNLQNKFIRIACDSRGDVMYIGNILTDDWVYFREFFKEAT